MEQNIYKVYVMTDDKDCIISVNSSAFISDTENWVQIDEGIDGLKYGHAQGNYFDKPLYTQDGAPRYKLVDGKAVERSEEEIEADKLEPPAPQPTAAELQEQITQTQLALTEVYEMMLGGI